MSGSTSTGASATATAIAYPKHFDPKDPASVEKAGIWAATKWVYPHFDPTNQCDVGLTLHQAVQASQHDQTWFMNQVRKPGE